MNGKMMKWRNHRKMILNKKYLLVICTVVLSVLGLTGCQKGNADTVVKNNEQVETEVTTETTKEAVEEEEATVQEGTKIISTAMGEVEVPVNPKRVIVNWYLGDVVTLGITPVAVYGWTDASMPFYDSLKEVPSIQNWDEEELLSYEPDLIITYSQEDFDNFSKIAPVVVIPESIMTSVERMEFLGAVTGHEAEAQAAINTFEQKLEAAKKVLSSNEFSDKTFSILQDWGSNSYGIYYETGSRGGTLLYDYLNLKLPDNLKKLIEESGEGRGSVSYEVAADYFGDYVLWFLTDENGSEFSQTEIWNSIPAVKAGNIIEVPASLLGLFYFSDVASMSAQMDYIIDKLNEVVADK
jgi:iron complex transport system substrate-binding protein